MTSQQALLCRFWESVYPWDAVLRFCLCDDITRLYNTEFMFDMGNGKMVRNLNGVRIQFRAPGDMRTFVLDRQHSAVLSIHRGVTYFDLQNHKEEQANKYLTLWHPLVLDVDATDYSDVRTCPCGEEKRVCKLCWDQYVVPTVDTIFTVCRVLGFSKIQAIFSGRRGMHVYVLDQKACMLLPRQRRMIVDRIKRRGVKLDEEVTYKGWHTLKMPCVPHSATGNVCCPLSQEEYHAFNPETMGTPYSKCTKEQMQYWARMLLGVVN